ncbi:MAG: phosphoribosylformylglycinamidine cyclo-ligase [Lachnospiraceae bacterium]|nr:phosphoribosylformylglycinamidine cyclo-ligase [Lachnospiraceae bacterium]
MDYKSSGVDIEAAYRAVELMKEHVTRTMRREVLTALGGFSGAFDIEVAKRMAHPTLVSGTDGVGTKLKLAFLMDKHDTIGIDCVAMCVNDIACSGAEPLFFLDYIACGKNEPRKIAEIVKGVSEGCIQAGCSLIGGETAEMPGFYPIDEYDLAGFAVGIVDRDQMISSASMEAGDVLIGIASSGIHSNGYSLVRRIYPMKRQAMDYYINELGTTLGEALLAPTKIYVSTLRAVRRRGIYIHGIAHITGGGFYENIPRMMGDGLRAVVKKHSYDIPPVFSMLATEGKIIDESVMYNTFNMGIGMVLAVPQNEADMALAVIRESGEKAWFIGEVVAGEKGIQLED